MCSPSVVADSVTSSAPSSPASTSIEGNASPSAAPSSGSSSCSSMAAGASGSSAGAFAARSDSPSCTSCGSAVTSISTVAGSGDTIAKPAAWPGGGCCPAFAEPITESPPGSSASTARIAAWSADGSGVTRPCCDSATTHSRYVASAVPIIASTAAVTGRCSSSSRLWIFSTSYAYSPRSARPTMRPDPLSVWKPRRTVASASRSPRLASSTAWLVRIVSSTSSASVR